MILSLVLMVATGLCLVTATVNLVVTWLGYKKAYTTENLVVALLQIPLYESMVGKENDSERIRRL